MAPVTRRPVSGRFMSGVDAGDTDPHHVTAKLTHLQNAVMPRRGVIEKRRGTTIELAGVPLTGMGTYEDDPIGINNGSVYHGLGSLDDPVVQGLRSTEALPVHVEVQEVAAWESPSADPGGAGQRWLDASVDSDSWHLLGIDGNGDPNVRTFRTATMALRDKPIFETGGSLAGAGKLLSTASNSYLFSIDTGGDLWVRAVAAGSNFDTAGTKLTTSGLGTADNLQVCLLPNGHIAACSTDYVWWYNPATNAVYAEGALGVANAQGTGITAFANETGFQDWVCCLVGSVNPGVTAAIYGVLAAPSGATISVKYSVSLDSWSDAGTAKVHPGQFALVNPFPDTTRIVECFWARVPRVDSPPGTTFAHRATQGASISWTGTPSAGAGAVVVPAYLVCQQALPVADPFLHNNKLFLPVFFVQVVASDPVNLRPTPGTNDYATGITTQRTVFLLRVLPGQAVPSYPVGRALVDRAEDPSGYNAGSFDTGTGGVGTWSPSHVSSTTDLGSGKFLIAAPVYRGNGTGGAFVTFDMSDSVRLRLEDDEEVMLIPGSIPYCYDGETVYENGLLVYPEIYIEAVAGTGWGGGGAGDGTFLYAATYQVYNRRGQLLESLTRFSTIDLDTASHASCNVRIPYLPFTHRDDTTVRIRLFRSTVGGGNQMREVFGSGAGNVAYPAAGFSYQVTFNDVGNANTFMPTLYMSSAAIPGNEPCPPYRLQCLHNKRHFIVHAEEPETTIRYSKYRVNGRHRVYNGIFDIQVPSKGGNIAAIASDHESLVVWKEDGDVFRIHGNGLNDLGFGQGFGTPRLISSNYNGCNPVSLLRVPQGLMFETEMGICLLTVSGSVEPIGRAVKKYTDAHEITAALVTEDDPHAMFFTLDGPCLVYNWLFGQWSTFTGLEAGAATYAGGKYWFYQPSALGSGYEDSRTNLADGQSLPMEWETGWIHPAGQLGYARLKKVLLAGYLLDATPHDKSFFSVGPARYEISFQYRLVPHWQDAQQIDAPEALDDKYFDWEDMFGAGLDATYNDKALVMEAHTSRQKGTAFRLRFREIERGDGKPVGRSIALTMFSMLYGIKREAKRGALQG